MRKLFKFIAPAMAGIMLLFGCAATAPASQTPAAPAAVEGGLTFTTGGEQGTYYRFGLVLAEKVAASTDTVLNTVVSEGSQENINALQNGSAMVGFAQTDVLSYAYEGTRLFDSKADKISMIAELYKEQLQIITLDPGLKSVADLKGKNVSIGSSGSGVYFNAIDVLEAYGLTERDISPTYQSFADSVNALKSGKIDAAFVVAGAPTSAVSGLAATDDVYMISLDEEHINKLIESSPHYSRAVIDKRTYNTAADINTVAVGAVLVASDEASEEDIYNVISGIYENAGAIAKVHSKGAELDIAAAAAVTSVPYHPGAAKYYAEKGITVPVK
ncbi:MAG: TAXI family TRAP transporter solute-binding subunit [Lachnospiraceae bacterium]|nr:TAXI family TRAP transporter solute-binding subunit [Lachnospiraceae bacterium]